MNKRKVLTETNDAIPFNEYCIAAFAIEDRVDFSLFQNGRNSHVFSAVIDGPDYFVCVRTLMAEALSDVAKDPKNKGNLRKLFNSIQSLVVSTAGVVHENQVLLQLPLWKWETTDTIRWEFDGQKRRFFEFGRELADIVSILIRLDSTERWSDTERNDFIKKVFVVNDATSSAIFEYEKALEDKKTKLTDFVYIKAHNGVGVGVIKINNEGCYEIPTSHAESGHFLPVIHSDDIDGGFMGACPFHGSCLEGMLATPSFKIRAESARSILFQSWNSILQIIEDKVNEKDELKRDDLIEKRLFKSIVGGASERGTAAGRELVAHYIAQLVHQLAIGPLAPSRIVLGGRMATPAVTSEVQQLVHTWMNGYPLRNRLVDKVDHFVVSSKASINDKRTIELCGALLLAYSRAVSKVGGLDLDKMKAIPIPDQAENLVRVTKFPVRQNRVRP